MIVVLGSLTCSAVCSYVESDYECEESDDSTLPPSSEDEGTGEPGMDCQESVEEMDAEDEDGDKQNVALEAVARCERPMSAARVGDKGPDRAGVRRRGKAGVRRGRGGGPGHGRGRGRGHGVAEAVTAALNEGLEGPLDVTRLATLPARDFNEPVCPKFKPARPEGYHIPRRYPNSPLGVFKLFFTDQVLEMLVRFV